MKLYGKYIFLLLCLTTFPFSFSQSTWTPTPQGNWNPLGRKTINNTITNTNTFTNKTTKNLNVLVVSLSHCGSSPKYTPKQIKDTVFGDEEKSVKNMMSYCSSGKMSIKGQIFPMTLDIPCDRFTPQCDYTGWSDKVDEYLNSNGYGKFRHRLYVVPEFCNFAGMGEVGCDFNKGTICKAWVNSLYANGASPYMHELGHNLGLMHSGNSVDEYGDPTDAMGSCCNIRCYSSIKSHQLGISSPRKIIIGKSNINVKNITLKNKDYIVVKYQSEWIYLQYYSPPGESSIEQIDGIFDDQSKYGVLIAYSTPPWNTDDQKFKDSVMVSKFGVTDTINSHSFTVFDIDIEVINENISVSLSAK